jgi:hypothetical protein
MTSDADSASLFELLRSLRCSGVSMPFKPRAVPVSGWRGS